MKKYLPIKVNGEWCLREENPNKQYIRKKQGQPKVRSSLYISFEKEAIANAKPIINHDGREWYKETDLRNIQIGFDVETKTWRECFDTSWAKRKGIELIDAWKYTGEKPVSAIPATNGKNYPMSEIRKQNGLKRDIIELVLNLAAPDDDCMLSDFLMALQFVLDKHQFDERNRIIGIIKGTVCIDELTEYGHGYRDALKNLLTKINNDRFELLNNPNHNIK